jgi:hypothetical protein
MWRQEFGADTLGRVIACNAGCRKDGAVRASGGPKAKQLTIGAWANLWHESRFGPERERFS